MSKLWVPPSDLDKECLDLCVALNRLDGIRTTSSCCGHGKDPYMIWFRAKDIPSLFVVGRVMSYNYGAPFHNDQRVWTTTLDINDMLHEQAGVAFRLATRDDIRGKLAYSFSQKLALDIRWYLDKGITGIESHLTYFNMDK